METELYSIQKKKFSELHSCFHRYTNIIKQKKQIDKNDFVDINEINNHIDIVISLLTTFNSGNSIKSRINNNHDLNKIIKRLNNDNKVINDLIPLAIMYRMTMDP